MIPVNLLLHTQIWYIQGYPTSGKSSPSVYTIHPVDSSHALVSFPLSPSAATMHFLALLAIGLPPVALAQSTSPFTKYTMAGPGINASFIPCRACLTNLLVNDKNANPPRRSPQVREGEQYLTDVVTVHTYNGPIVGRYAHRIKKGTFTVDAVTSHISQKQQMGKNSLHGGTVGCGREDWTIVSSNASSITFSLFDYGYESFLGQVVTYATSPYQQGRDGLLVQFLFSSMSSLPSCSPPMFTGICAPSQTSKE